MKKKKDAVETAKTETVPAGTVPVETVPAVPEAVVKPKTVAELDELVKAGKASGPFRGFGVEKSKAYQNLVGGYELRIGGKTVTVPAHPEDAAAFRRSKVTGEVLVWKLPAEGKVAVVRACASGSGTEIVVRTSDLHLKRFAADAKPGKSSGGKSSRLVAEDEPTV